ncbi:MAG TPA: FecR domain-containing protein [Leptospiraceae bacterium]|nr:FecR domain-containing protein [Leptospiraceae bacterium]HMZ57946.1 FecR domain-containing protein [Leptospiraceae bacterium]HNF15896.1 FecR domain-containing protein [Leptospiraceae bacterium]HNI97158.1 FecR domain-containing protein [Leptospiraceae bacterium]HNM06584.1 FecR domain-containing protein [Leptospiraceae bacterium]
MEELNEAEKKIKDALDGMSNEYTGKVKTVNQALGKKFAYKREFPEFDSLLSDESKQSQILEFRKKTMNKKIIYILSAAAVLLGGVFAAITFKDGSGKGDEKNKVSQEAKVTFVSGNVTVKTSDGKETKAAVGTVIPITASIITANKSMADVQFGQGNTIRIKANSEASIKSIVYGAVSEEEVFLKKGVIMANVSKKKQNDTFNIMTPTVIAGVRGTVFQVMYNPQNPSESTVISVGEGSIAVTPQKDGKPLSPEPKEILDSDDQAIEKGIGGEIVKKKISHPEMRKILDDNFDIDDEKELLQSTGRSEIEKLTLDDKTILRGVVIDMDDANFTVQTMDGIVKIPRSKVISSESEKLK